MPVHPVNSLDDPRVAPYRNLKDRELARQGGRFIAEGEHLVRRLLASHYKTESVLLAERRLPQIAPLVPADVPVYVTAQKVMDQIIGFHFHSGAIAVGLRKEPAALDDVVPRDRARLTLMICPEITNGENLGSMIRIAAAFGLDALILGERCHDPFWRQSIRVSMGTIFRLPIVRSPDLMRDLGRLREQWGVQLAATVLDPDAEPLAGARRAPRLGLLFGSEAHGLDRTWVNACDRRLTIPMQLGTDSLNVAVSAGIFLHHFTQGEGASCERTTNERPKC